MSTDAHRPMGSEYTKSDAVPIGAIAPEYADMEAIDQDAPLPQMHLLIVDDDAPIRTACNEVALSMGFITMTAESVAVGRSVLTQRPIDMVLLDMKLPGEGGLVLLQEIRQRSPSTVVVVMTAYATVSSAVEAMRLGASDYLTKPFRLEELTVVLDRAARRRSYDLESRSLRERLRSGKGMGSLIGDSPAMEKLYRMLSKVAATTHPVLIAGESGTGKELVARTMHANGPMAAQPFVPVDCASLMPGAIESELFGTTAPVLKNGNTRPRSGLLAAAEGGTVYLDEIGEIGLDLQAKLLRTLQERQVRPVGGTRTVPLTARILAGTSRDLQAMVASGRFRRDLYYRLNVVTLRIPPLRERNSDIPLLAATFLQRMRARARDFNDESLHLLMQYDWPGNVRELEQAIERASSLSSGPLLHMADFPTQLQNHQQAELQRKQELRQSQASRAAESTARPGVLSIAEMEKQAIINTIRELSGDKLTAAKLLGIGKTTLYRKLKEYELTDEQLRG